MTRKKLLLAGLIAGAMTLGTACKSDKSAERAEPTEPAQDTSTEQGGTTDQEGTTPGGTEQGGTGGAGYEEDDPRFQRDQELGGDKFPSDDIVPRP